MFVTVVGPFLFYRKGWVQRAGNEPVTGFDREQ
jgi:hypothetical protein